MWKDQVPACVCLVVGLFVLSPAASAQPVDDVSAVVGERDRLFWNAYNTCDVQAMPEYLAEDVEFYHDQGGILLGAAKVVGSIRDNLCSRPGWRLRREAVAGTVQLFPLKDGATVYGAVISGEHLFYVREKGRPERADGQASFLQLWLLKNGTWRMARILSYDHGLVRESR